MVTPDVHGGSSPTTRAANGIENVHHIGLGACVGTEGGGEPDSNLEFPGINRSPVITRGNGFTVTARHRTPFSSCVIT